MALLNTPIKINELHLSNRLVMPPMATGKSNPNGEVSPALCDYYTTRSQGGAIGLIITEHSYVSLAGKASRGQLSLAEDRDIQGLKQLVEACHRDGTKVMAQLNHAGGAASSTITGCTVLGASPVEIPSIVYKGALPKEMTQEEINGVIQDFATAAVRAKQAGFDGVEIHAAHGYLLSQFYSPLTNKRTDGYSGSTLAGRIALHLQVIAAVRQAVGRGYPVALRFGACDYREGGSTLADSVEAAKAFEQAGIDLLDVSGGLCAYQNPNNTEQGYFCELSEAMKQVVSIPVLLTGGIVDGTVADQLLKEGKADLIGVGRAILKDAQWAKQALANLVQ